jgi:hypothetical protein
MGGYRRPHRRRTAVYRGIDEERLRGRPAARRGGSLRARWGIRCCSRRRELQPDDLRNSGFRASCVTVDINGVTSRKDMGFRSRPSKAIPGPRPWMVGPARERTFVPDFGTCQSPAHASSSSSAFTSLGSVVSTRVGRPAWVVLHDIVGRGKIGKLRTKASQSSWSSP